MSMLFNEEMYNFHSGGGNTLTGFVDSVWKPPPAFSSNANDLVGPYDSKLRKWGAPCDYGGGSNKGGQQQGGGDNSLVSTPLYGHAPFWNEQTPPFHPSQQQPGQHGGDMHDGGGGGKTFIPGQSFHPGTGLVNSSNGLYTATTNSPPEMAAQQWGRSEINQTTPWDVNVMEQQNGQGSHPGQQPQQRFRKWEQPDNGGVGGGLYIPKQQDFNPYTNGSAGFNASLNGFGGAGAGMQQPGFGDRMMPNGMPTMGGGGRGAGGMPGGGQRGSGNTWMDGGNKYGSGDHGRNGGSAASQQLSGGLFMPGAGPMNLTAPPPPLNMMRQMMGPPPPLHSMPPLMSNNPPMHHQQQGGQQQPQNSFSMGTFSMPNQQQSAQNQVAQNEDSMWQDPNGDLRKWQRDTGTSIWGDPAKQTGPIQRWQQFTAEEVAATSTKPNILKEGGETSENGWGDLPPLNGQSTSQQQPQHTHNGGGQSQQQHHHQQYQPQQQMMQQQQDHIKAPSVPRWQQYSNAVSAGEESTKSLKRESPDQDGGGSVGWGDLPPLNGQSNSQQLQPQYHHQQMQQQQQPMLLQQQQQPMKVSLADELSSIALNGVPYNWPPRL